MKISWLLLPAFLITTIHCEEERRRTLARIIEEEPTFLLDPRPNLGKSSYVAIKQGQALVVPEHVKRQVELAVSKYQQKGWPRYPSFIILGNLLAQRLYQTSDIFVSVELGTARDGENNCEWDGCSTMVLANTLMTLAKGLQKQVKFTTVDKKWSFINRVWRLLKEKILEKGILEEDEEESTIKWIDVHAITSDSLEYFQGLFKKNTTQLIDMLYVDSVDWDDKIVEQVQLQVLKEIITAYPLLHSGSIVMIDGCHLGKYGGKCGLAEKWLVARGWRVINKDGLGKAMNQHIYIYDVQATSDIATKIVEGELSVYTLPSTLDVFMFTSIDNDVQGNKSSVDIKPKKKSSKMSRDAWLQSISLNSNVLDNEDCLDGLSPKVTSLALGNLEQLLNNISKTKKVNKVWHFVDDRGCGALYTNYKQNNEEKEFAKQHELEHLQIDKSLAKGGSVDYKFVKGYHRLFIENHFKAKSTDSTNGLMLLVDLYSMDWSSPAYKTDKLLSIIENDFDFYEQMNAIALVGCSAKVMSEHRVCDKTVEWLMKHGWTIGHRASGTREDNIHLFVPKRTS